MYYLAIDKEINKKRKTKVFIMGKFKNLSAIDNGIYLRKSLRKMREQQGLSRNDLAIRAGLSKSLLEKFELGHIDLGFVNLMTVFSCLGKMLVGVDSIEQIMGE